MNGEKHGGEPGSRDLQPDENRPEEERARQMKHEVDDMITDRGITEKPPLDPKGSVGEWKIVYGSGGEPDFGKAAGGLNQGIVGDQGVVVPNEFCVEYGGVGEEAR